jgi:hypothetical protein
VSLALAERLLNDPESDAIARLQQAYQLALNRAPTPAETDRALTFLAQFAREYQPKPIVARPLAAILTAKVPTTPIDPDNIDRTDASTPEEPVQPANATTASWMQLVQALFASAEFRFIR